VLDRLSLEHRILITVRGSSAGHRSQSADLPTGFSRLENCSPDSTNMRLAILVVIPLLTPHASAQTTADGIRALIRSDYAAAAHILRPLAEGKASPDPIAQFFMAELYKWGLGVAADDLHACGLFKLASYSPAVRPQALTLAADIHQDHPLLLEACQTPRVGAETGTGAVRHVDAVQTTLLDGVEAWLRGDYQRAADALYPLVSTTVVDPLAAFFMAMMYHSGQGASYDDVRACALYMKAEEGAPPLFGRLASELSRSWHLGADLQRRDECSMLASVGFEHGFQPLTFMLGPGHSISVEIEGATIDYHGKHVRLDRLFELVPGAVHLPARHTAMRTRSPRPARRDFIELFRWQPSQPPETWALRWSLFEVIRDDVLDIISQELLAVSSPRPPDDLDYRELAEVLLNEAGEAEWVVHTGNPRSEFIESEEERLTRQSRDRAREAAERAFDWTRPVEASRTPGLAYADTEGCANLYVYGTSADRTEIIQVRAEKDVLQLSTVPRTFDIGSQLPGLAIVVFVYDRPVRYGACSDVRDPGVSLESWTAVGGTVSIQISPPGELRHQPGFYRATIHIVGAEFVNGTGGRVRLSQPLTLTAIVGGVSG
jgi:TPR repeat protein